jgi:MFS transporter, FHS family, glucose/mannose:H+ symporter
MKLTLHLAFLAIGSITLLLGPLLPHLAAAYQLSDAQAGRFFLTQFFASTTGAVALEQIQKRWQGFERLLPLSFVVMACAVFGLGSSRTFEAGLAWTALYGLSLGIANPAASQIAAARLASGGNIAAEQNLLNMSWSLGAVLTPPLLGSILGGGFGIREALLAAAVAPTLAALFCIKGILQPPPPGVPAAPAHAVQTTPGQTPVKGGQALAWLTGAFLLIYVGAEAAFSGWLPTMAIRFSGLGPSIAGMLPSLFWIAILSGRLVAGAIAPQWTSPRGWMIRGLAVAVLGISIILFLAPLHDAWLLLGTFIAGAGFAPQFPTAIAEFQRRTPDTASRAIGYVFAAGGVGGALVPWLYGTFSQAAGDLRSTVLWATLVLLAILCALWMRSSPARV